MKKKVRIPVIIGAAVIGIFLILFYTVLFMMRKPFPKTKGTIKIAGLGAACEIYRDADGIPHIYAETMEDLFFAQGFVHAQDRFWQMEFWRRVGAGRLSELFGESVLGVDIYMRTVGFHRIAEQELALLSDETVRYMEAYAAGVNAYILNRTPTELALEFLFLKLKGVEPEIEPWTPSNSLTWFKLMAEDLCANMDRELTRVDLIRSVGIEMAEQFFPAYRENEMPFVIDEDENATQRTQEKKQQVAEPSVDEVDLLNGFSTTVVGSEGSGKPILFGKGTGVGSNAWVISGTRTSTGLPLLANDPHLGIQMPSIWYEVDLHSKRGGGGNGDRPFHVRGFSFPGVPGIIIGHNERIAWGFTNMYADVQDLYIERINPHNPNQYEVNGEWVDMDIRREEIVVQGQDEPYVLLVRSTRHGPVITDQGKMIERNSFGIIHGKSFPENLDLTVLSLCWTALTPQRVMDMIMLLNRAEDFEEFHEALRYFTVPAQNVIYADIEGNIGYQAPGIIPIRRSGDGLLPVPGWTDEYEWSGYIPYEELPNCLNPSKGYIVTANNPIVSKGDPHELPLDYDHGYRARRIVDMIEQGGSDLSLSDMKKMQGDNLSLSAFEILPYLKTLPVEDPQVQAALAHILEWDGKMEMDSARAALYAYVWVALVEEIFKDQVPDRVWNRDGALASGSQLQSCVYSLLQDPFNRWWDDAKTLDRTETRDEILLRVLKKAYIKGTKALGSELDSWRWGDIHSATFQNQTLGKSGIGLIENIFNRGPVSTAGGFQQVNRSDFSIEKPFEVYHISSMRQIIDLSDLSNSLMIHSTGQSGHPRHPHYDDFIDQWRTQGYHSAGWEREDIVESSKEKLVLEPVGSE